MLSAVSLFTGAGGMDLGFESAGFETKAAIEMYDQAVMTLKHNRDWLVFDRNIHEVTSEELKRESQLKEGELVLLHGGPPCQPFSKSGYWARGDSKRLADPRATTLEAYLRVLRDLKPQVFVLENVSGIAYSKKDEGLKLLKETIDSINQNCGTAYSFKMEILNAANYGVPQERERAFIVGERSGKEFDFPKPTHQILKRPPSHTIKKTTKPIPFFSETSLPIAINCWESIGEFEEDDNPELKLTGKWAELVPSIPEGCNYLYHTDRGDGLPLFGWRRRYWNFLLKLSKQYPSWTIQAQPGSAVGPFHWRNRWLSRVELARIQTFPDSYMIQGTRRHAHRQLGNAVPCALAEILAHEIRKQFLSHSDSDIGPRKLVQEKKFIIPKAHPHLDVKDKYMKLLHTDTAHPGKGQGRSYL